MIKLHWMHSRPALWGLYILKADLCFVARQRPNSTVSNYRRNLLTSAIFQISIFSFQKLPKIIKSKRQRMRMLHFWRFPRRLKMPFVPFFVLIFARKCLCPNYPVHIKNYPDRNRISVA